MNRHFAYRFKTAMTAPALPDAEAIREALRQVVDPEVGANIVDLGLIYRIDIAADGLAIDLTMTSPACPLGDLIMDDMRDALEPLLPVGYPIDLRLVWDPPWDPSRMSPRTRRHLGW